MGIILNLFGSSKGNLVKALVSQLLQAGLISTIVVFLTGTLRILQKDIISKGKLLMV